MNPLQSSGMASRTTFSPPFATTSVSRSNSISATSSPAMFRSSSISTTSVSITTVSSMGSTSIFPNIHQGVSAGVLHSRPIEAPLKFTEADHSPRDADIRKRRSLMSDFNLTQHNPVIPQMPSASTGGDKVTAAHIQKDTATRRSSAESHLPAYTPQVENISPTPDDIDDLSNTDKGEILDTINKVDREIAMVEEKVKKLHKKKQELEESTSAAALEPVAGDTSATTVSETASKPSAFERIYAENRQKAAAAHARLSHLDPPGGYPPVPLYRQPSDIKELQDIIERNKTFRPKLMDILRRRHEEKVRREKNYTEMYEKMMQEWQTKLDRIERNPKRLAREVKYREIFEKTFPELKKQREEKERLMRADGRPKPDFDPLFSYDSYYDQDEEERRKLHQNAVLPPIPLDDWSRKRTGWTNNNNLVRDPINAHKTMLDHFRISWNEEEKRSFRQKFIQYGKNFAAIAIFFDRKNTKDCVQYYYLTKKRENYKQLMRRPYRRRGKPYKPPQMPKIEDSVKESNDNDNEANTGTTAEEAKPEPEYFCIECKSKIDASNPGRVLTRSCYEQYGLDPLDPSAQEARICAKCRLNDVRRYKSQCSLGICGSAKRRTKPKLFPNKWFELSGEQKKIISDEFKITDNTTKCCQSCYKRLFRRIEIIMETPVDENQTQSIEMTSIESTTPNIISGTCSVIVTQTQNIKQEWSEDEVFKMKELSLMSSNDNRDWAEVTKDFPGRSIDECRTYFTSMISGAAGMDQQNSPASSETKLRLKLAQVAGIEEEEDEEEAQNSDDEVTRMTETNISRIPSPKDGVTPVEKSAGEVKHLAIDQGDVKSAMDISETPREDDRESCATLSADEMTDQSKNPTTTTTILKNKRQAENSANLNVEIMAPRKSSDTSSSSLHQQCVVTANISLASSEAIPARMPENDKFEYMKLDRMPMAKTASNMQSFRAAAVENLPKCRRSTLTPSDMDPDKPSTSATTPALDVPTQRQIITADDRLEAAILGVMNQAVMAVKAMPMTSGCETPFVSTDVTMKASYPAELKTQTVTPASSMAQVHASSVTQAAELRAENRERSQTIAASTEQRSCESPVVVKVIQRSNSFKVALSAQTSPTFTCSGAAGGVGCNITTGMVKQQSPLPPAALRSGSLTSGKPVVVAPLVHGGTQISPSQNLIVPSPTTQTTPSGSVYRSSPVPMARIQTPTSSLSAAAPLINPYLAPPSGHVAATTPTNLGRASATNNPYTLDQSKMFHTQMTGGGGGAASVVLQPSPLANRADEGAGRAMSADMYKDKSCSAATEPSRYTPVGTSSNSQNFLMPNIGSAEVAAYEALLRRQSMAEQHHQQQQQQQAAVAALYNQALLGALPAAAAHLLGAVDLRAAAAAALQMGGRNRAPSPQTGASTTAAAQQDTANLLAAAAAARQTQQQQQQQINKQAAMNLEAQRAAALNLEVQKLQAHQAAALNLEAHKFNALNLEAQKAVYLQRQLVEQHFLEHQFRMEQQQQQQQQQRLLAEHQQRVLMANELEKMRLAEQFYQQQQQHLMQQQQQASSSSLSSSEARDQQQQQQHQMFKHVNTIRQPIAQKANVSSAGINQQAQNLGQQQQQQMLAQQRQQTPQQQFATLQQNLGLTASPQALQQAANYQHLLAAAYQQAAAQQQAATPTNVKSVDAKTVDLQRATNQQQLKQQAANTAKQFKLLDQLHATIASGQLPYPGSGRQSIIQQSATSSKTAPAPPVNVTRENNPHMEPMASAVRFCPPAKEQQQQNSAAPPTKAAMKEFPPQPVLKKTASITDLFSQNLIQPISKATLFAPISGPTSQQLGRSPSVTSLAYGSVTSLDHQPQPKKPQTPIIAATPPSLAGSAQHRPTDLAMKRRPTDLAAPPHPDYPNVSGRLSPGGLLLQSPPTSAVVTSGANSATPILPTNQQSGGGVKREKVTAQTLIDSMITKHHFELATSTSKSQLSSSDKKTDPTGQKRQSFKQPPQPGGANIIQQIDSIIIDAYGASSTETARLKNQAKPTIVEPITPEAPPSTTNNYFGGAVKTEVSVSDQSRSSNVSAGGFEYDLEPVSPPNAGSGGQSETTPVTPPTSPGSALMGGGGASVTTVGAPMHRAAGGGTGPGTPVPPPFVAFSVLTLPPTDSGGASGAAGQIATNQRSAPVIGIGQAPMGGGRLSQPTPPWFGGASAMMISATNSGKIWPPVVTTAKLTGQLSTSHSDDSESMRAVAALIENEFDSSQSSSTGAAVSSGGQAQCRTAAAPVNLTAAAPPTYEPLSDDDES